MSLSYSGIMTYSPPDPPIEEDPEPECNASYGRYHDWTHSFGEWEEEYFSIQLRCCKGHYILRYTYRSGGETVYEDEIYGSLVPPCYDSMTFGELGATMYIHIFW